MDKDSKGQRKLEDTQQIFHGILGLWFNYNVMDAVNVVMLYLAIIYDTTNEFLPGENKDLLN